MKAFCAVAQIVKQFPGLALPPGVAKEPVGAEKQNMTIVLSSADGCKVVL